MNRTQNSAKNFAVGMASQAITILLRFIAQTVFLKILSAEYLGINGLLSNVLTVLSFAELGIGEAMTYAMYKPAKENDHEMMRRLLAVYKKAYALVAVIVGGVGFFLSFFINFIVSEPPNIPESMQVIFFLYILNNMASYLLVYKKSVLIAYQKNYVISYVTQATSIAQQVFQILLLSLTRQYYVYLIVQIACSIANNVIIAVVVKKQFPWLNGKEKERLPQSVSKEIIKNVKALSLSRVAGVVSNGADNIIISKIVGLASLGVVSNYNLIINSLNGILWGGLSSITSSFGNFNVDSSVERKRSLFDEIFLCSYWLYGFLAVGIITLINSFVELWLGNAYMVPQSIVLVLVLNVYIGGVNFPLYVYQTTLGMYDKMKVPFVLFGILNIILSIVLGVRIGLLGIYLATSISRICTSEVAGAYYVYHDGLKLSPFKYAVKYVGCFALVLINAIITGWIVSKITIGGVLGLAIKIIVCSIICNVIFVLCFCKTASFSRLKRRAINLLLSRGN